jgi:resuscitation-promoting factor RpfA
MQNQPTAPPRASSTEPETSARRRRGLAAVAATLGTTALVSAVSPAPADAFSRRVGTVWDRVAACESSGRWHINTGNGYYGGLQFSRRTWVGFHGHKYARRADRATRAEQIEVARRVLAAQGRGAWPVCGPRAGLTKRSGGATRQPLPRIAGR